jgi:RimJ/RimL family protein N-acetyltransferase
MEYIIREARPDDAEQLLARVAELAAEPGIDVPLAPGEFTLTLEEERETIRDYAESPNSVFLVAENAGEIIGSLNLRGGRRAALRHAATLGITVRRDWRGQGVGTALMQAALDWARPNPIVTRIELLVYLRNTGAIRLYERFGFEVEGRRRRAIYQDGEYLDELGMALLLPVET